MNKQTAVPALPNTPAPSTTSGKGRQQTAFYDVLTQLTLQQMRHRASQRS